MTFASNSLLI